MTDERENPGARTDAEPRSELPSGAPFIRSWLTAWIAGAAALWAAFALSFDAGQAAMASLDFNGELFADLLGPYWRTAEALADGRADPDPQYLYPGTLAVLLQPFTALGPAGASWIGVAMGLLSVSLLIGSALVLRAPRGPAGAAILGLAVLLSFPVVHGAYWANAGPLSLALGAFGWCLASRKREHIGGVLIGFGAAIKVLPALLIIGLLLHGKRRGAAVAAATAVVLGVLLPVLSMGASGFIEFHGVTVERLMAMARSCRTPLGGQGSQDLVAVSARVAGSTAPWWGYLAGILAAIWAVRQAMVGRSAGPRGGSELAAQTALLWLLAAPGFLVSPTWAHGLTWLPLVWWWVLPRLEGSGIGWALLLGSMAAGSLPAAWLAGDPTLYLISAAPLVSAVLGLAALQVASRPD